MLLWTLIEKWNWLGYCVESDLRRHLRCRFTRFTCCSSRQWSTRRTRYRPFSIERYNFRLTQMIWFPNSYFDAWRRRYQGGVSGRNGISFSVHRNYSKRLNFKKIQNNLKSNYMTWQPIFELKGCFIKKYNKIFLKQP